MEFTYQLWKINNLHNKHIYRVSQKAVNVMEQQEKKQGKGITNKG